MKCSNCGEEISKNYSVELCCIDSEGKTIISDAIRDLCKDCSFIAYINADRNLAV